MQVAGDRELAFFPGLARGGIYPGFDYASEAGARAVPLTFLPSTAHQTGAGASRSAILGAYFQKAQMLMM